MTLVPITVRFNISLAGLSGSSGAPIVFLRWLPMGQENGISFHHDACSGTLWFEPESAPWINDVASIEATINVQVESMRADIVTPIDGDLAAWIKNRDCKHAPTADEKPLADRYERLGVAVDTALAQRAESISVLRENREGPALGTRHVRRQWSVIPHCHPATSQDQ